MALAVPACGGDEEEPARSPQRPELTVPTGTEPAPPNTTSAPTAPTTAPPSGGAPAPPQRTTPDSPGNDVAPPPGTPAERFEKFCDENPGACG